MFSSIWKDGIMGVIIGDALGCPVQFMDRRSIARQPVTKMAGYGTYNMPPGTWTDDGSLTLATLVSIRENKGINPADIMYRFALWLTKGEYTPFGEAFDNGRGTTEAIVRYMNNPDVSTCGGTTVRDNGNGSLMRIIPVCLYCYDQQQAGKLTDADAIALIDRISGLTHNHMRAKIACGLYYFMIRELLNADGSLIERLQKGSDAGTAFYMQDPQYSGEISRYGRLRDLSAFRGLPASEIKSSGYVVDTLEAAVWSLLKTDTFRDALLAAVNLGDDTDTVGAICGGLAGLYYGYDEIPDDWLAAIRRRDWIENLCK